MEKDKQLMLLQGEQALVRVDVQMGLVNKVLEEDELLFSKVRKVVLRCETVDGFEEFVVDSDITELDLFEKKIITLPIEIGQLSNLTELDLRFNQLISLPAVIGQLINLTEFYLSYNQLTSLPKEIGQLTKLTKLYLSSNQLTTLPKEIGQLTKLKELDLWNNQFSSNEIDGIRLLLPKTEVFDYENLLPPPPDCVSYW
jgi:Leucine-rich repeat (LRR) protein